MKTIRRPISILLAVLMVVGMFTMVPISAGATVYTENEIGEYVTTGDIIHLQGDYIEFETYSVVLKGGTYKVAGSNEVAQSDIQLGEAWSGSGVTVHSDGFRYNGTKYVPVDANGYESGSWLVLDVNNDDGVITFRGMCDYYLAGTMNMWDTNDGTYELAKNPGNTDEYMLLDFAADANTEFKVVSVGEYIAPTNNFTLNEAGTYDIYFRPNGGGNTADGWVDGKVFANNFRPASSATYVAQIGDTKYETLDAAITAAQAGDTVKLLENVTLTEALVIPEGKNFTLDLNGKDITGNVNDKLVQNNGTVVVDDTSAAPGHIYNTNIDKQGNAAFVNYGTATVKNGYFGDKNSDMTDANDVNRGAGFQNQGTAVIDGGYFTACDNFTPAETGNNGYAYAIINYGDITINDATVYGKNNGNLANDAGTMTVNGGNFSLVKGAKKNYYSIYNGSDSANSIVNGGTFTNTTGTALTHTGVGTTELNGGSFTYTKFEQSKTGHPTVSGGTFNKAVPEAYCAEGFIPVTNTDGTYTVDGPYVAKIGTTGYATLADAFAAAVDDDTITVLANSAGNGIKVTPAGKFATNGLTVDFAGHTYTVDGETVGSTGTETNGFQLLKNNKVTFKNGTITSAKAKILVQNYSDLTLEGMTLTLNNPDYTEAYTLSNNNGNIVIDGTTINANPAGGFAFDVCRFSSYPSVNVKVTGTSDIQGDVEISASKGQAKDGFSLTLESGSMSGAIVVDASAQALVGEVNKVTKKDTFAKEAPEGFKWVSNEDGTSSLAPIPYVAQIGNTKYETLEAAFAAAVDGDTITVLADSAGNGIQVLKNKFKTKGLTVDFDHHTYTMDGATVGSPGTATQAFQLQYGNKITFKNGTLYSEKALFLVQNYSNLTLDGMTLTLNNPNYAYGYTLSNNYGNTVIKDTTINANPAGKFAFDVCRGGGSNAYKYVHVTVTDNSVINGNVEVDARNGDPRDGFSLNLESGTLNGEIKLTANAETAIDNNPDNASVNKKNTFNQDPAAGYKWKDNGDGTSTLVKIPKLFAGNGLALHGDIGVIFYLNPEAAGFSLNQVSSVSVDFACDKYSGTVTEFTKDDATGCIKVAYYVPVAYMASDIIASNVKINNLPAIGTDTYSVQTYALDTINDPNAPAARKTLMKEMLNYGAKAKAVFESQMANPEDAVYEEIPDYTKTTVTVDMIDDAIEGEATDMSTVTPEPGAKFYGSSVIYLSETTLRMVFAIPDGSGSKLPENAYTGHQGKWYHWVDKKDIPAAQLHKQQTFTVGNATFNYSALDYAKAVLNSNMDQANKDLVSAMYLYNQAAIACFA